MEHFTESLIFLCIYVSKYKLLESRLEETVQQMMKIKEEKIFTLENKLEQSNKLNTTLRAELATVRTCMPHRLLVSPWNYCSAAMLPSSKPSFDIETLLRLL